MVSVMPRTWPGMNRPGGLGHIEKNYTATALNPAAAAFSNDNAHCSGGSIAGAIQEEIEEVTHVDVKYLQSELASRDRGIPVQYVADQHRMALEIMGGNVGARCGAGRRHRRNLINSRRCTECGSFAIDCGNCDWRNEELRRTAQTRRREEERWEKEDEQIMERQQHRVVVGRRKKRRERMNGYYYVNSTSTDEGGGSSSSSRSGDDDNEEEPIIDSEEEEMRKVKTVNRHRMKNGQITRRRRRVRQDNERDNRNNDHPHDASDDDDDDDDDEVPLAILQRRRERAIKVREQKLRDMKLMMNGQDRQLLHLPSSHNGGIRIDNYARHKKRAISKEKKHSNRTRPQNACALMGIVTEKRCIGDANMVHRQESNTKSKERRMNVIRRDADSEEWTETTNERKNIPGAATTFDFERDSSSDDDDLVTFCDLRSRAMFIGGRNPNDRSSDSNYNLCVDKNSLPSSVDESSNQDGADEELLTPREFNDDKNEGDSGSERYDFAREPTYLLDDDDSSGDEGKSTRLNSTIVRDLNWGDLPNFINELCHEVHSRRIVHVQNTLSALKRKLRATMMGVSRSSSSLHKTATSQEMLDTLVKLSEERYEVFVVSDASHPSKKSEYMILYKYDCVIFHQ